MKVLLALIFMTVSVHAQDGIASVYGNENGQWRRADGHRYFPNQIGCAYKWGRLGSILVVTNLKNGRTIHCPLNDRGPYVRGRLIDLSKGAARALGAGGLTRVRVQ